MCGYFGGTCIFSVLGWHPDGCEASGCWLPGNQCHQYPWQLQVELSKKGRIMRDYEIVRFHSDILSIFCKMLTTDIPCLARECTTQISMFLHTSTRVWGFLIFTDIEIVRCYVKATMTIQLICLGISHCKYIHYIHRFDLQIPALNKSPKWNILHQFKIDMTPCNILRCHQHLLWISGWWHRSDTTLRVLIHLLYSELMKTN